MAARSVQIAFRNMSTSPALEAEIHSRAEWLESFYPAIVGCRVMLEIPHRHRQRGRPLHIRIEVSLPGEDVIVNHEPADHDGRHKDALAAVHDAFDAARRRLQDAARRQRGDVKTKAGITES